MIYILKITASDRHLVSYQVIYAYHPQNDVYYVLVLVDRALDYESGKNFIQKIAFCTTTTKFCPIDMMAARAVRPGTDKRFRLHTDPRKREAMKKAQHAIATAIPHKPGFALSKLCLQAELARRLDMQQLAIACLEKGEVIPQVSMVFRLSEALGVSREAVLAAFEYMAKL